MNLIKSQLLYRLSYGLKTLVPQGILRRIWHSIMCRNGNRTAFRPKHKVTSIVPSPRMASGPCSGVQYFDERGWEKRRTLLAWPRRAFGVLFLLGSVLLGYMFGGDDPDRDVRDGSIILPVTSGLAAFGVCLTVVYMMVAG